MYLKLEERIDLFDKEIGMLVPDGMYDWLVKNGFFDKPASLSYHGNYSGGLFDHSYAVMTFLADATRNMDLTWKKERSPYIVGMFHDLCKIENYEKNEGTGAWYHNTDLLLPGHGDKSIMLLSQFMTLTEEEIYCIRFHMGPYEKWSRDQYSQAIKKYENVLWTHTADMYAANVKGI